MTKKLLSAAVLSLMMGGLLAHAETPYDSTQTTPGKADIVSQQQKTDTTSSKTDSSTSSVPDAKQQLNTAEQTQKSSTEQPSEGTTK